MQDPSRMSVAQLREMAKSLGVKGYEKLKKAEAYKAVMSIIDPEGRSKADKPAARRGRPPKAASDKAAGAVKSAAEQDAAPAGKKSEPAAEAKQADKKAAKPAAAASSAKKRGAADDAKKSAAAGKKSAAGKAPAAKPAARRGRPAKTAQQSKPADEAPAADLPVSAAQNEPAEAPGTGAARSAKKAPKGTEIPGEAGRAKKPGRPRKIVRDDSAIMDLEDDLDIDPFYSEEDEKLQKARAEADERRAAAKARAAALGIDLPAGVEDYSELDSGEMASGILELVQEGTYGFIRSDNYMPSERDIYVAPSHVKHFMLRTGDAIEGPIRKKTGAGNERFSALLYPTLVNGVAPTVAAARKRFESLTPIFPNERIRLERPGGSMSMRIMDLISPVGKGQRGMIVSPPKAGKTTLLKDVAMSVKTNHPNMNIIILLIDERPEEVTDIKECLEGQNVEVVHSTFDELPEHHKRVSEMVLNRAKRLVEQGQDVMILLDSITRLSRAYNLVVSPTGRTLSGGLDPAALYNPKKFFGAARNIREGGSLTILATALVDTGSRMDDVIFEEFKGTGNMELVLDRKLSEKRVFPAMDILKSGTRRDDLLLEPEEYDTMYMIRKAVSTLKPEDATEKILDLFAHTKTNAAFLQFAKKIMW